MLLLLAQASQQWPESRDQRPRQFWFRISYFVTRRSYITLLVAIGTQIPFALEFSTMVRLLSLNLSKCTHRLISQSYWRICICSLIVSLQRASSDNNLVLWRTSESLKYLKVLASSLSIRAIDPYQVRREQIEKIENRSPLNSEYIFISALNCLLMHITDVQVTTVNFIIY